MDMDAQTCQHNTPHRTEGDNKRKDMQKMQGSGKGIISNRK